MATDVTTAKPEFDTPAQDRTRQLLAAGEAHAALEWLESHEARDPLQRIALEEHSAEASWRLGRFAEALAALTRTLRLTSKHPERRAGVRNKLAHLLMFAGESTRAAEQVRRALVDVHRGVGDGAVEPHLLLLMGRIHRYRGMVSASVQAIEQAIALFDHGPETHWGRVVAVAQLAVTLGTSGDDMDLARANELIDSAIRQSDSLATRERVSILSVAVDCALLAGDVARAEAMMADIAALDPGRDSAGLVADVEQGMIFAARGRHEEAIAVFHRVLDEVVQRLPNGGMVPTTSRLLATSLLAAGRTAEALEKAQLAVRVGRRMDIMEWAAGLRIVGECLVAENNLEQARARFAEALSVLQSTEFAGERRRVHEAMRGTGMTIPEAPRAEAPASTRAASRTRRAEPLLRTVLNDGQVFLSRDGDLMREIAQAASSRLPVLIEGETGTGKELVARIVHELGPAPRSPFVVVDCTLLPQNLAETELFGAARGAYTGAVADRPGLVAMADQGTLFLDELSELAPTIQAMLLRFVQEGTYRRVGENRVRRVRARLIAATNRDVEVLLAQGRLKRDLFFRLNGHRLQLRPLRERQNELADLVREFARSEGMAGVSAATVARLKTFSWPGNVRELEMCVRSAASRVPRGSWLEPEAIVHRPVTPDPSNVPPTTLRGRRIEVERQAIEQALRDHDGNVAAASRALGISRQAFYKALRRTAQN